MKLDSTAARLLAAVAGGVALGIGLRDPLARPAGIFLFLFAALPLAAWLGARLRVAALAGVAHGVAFWLVAVPWIYTVMRLHGGLDAITSAAVLLLLAVYLSLYSVAVAIAIAFISRRSLPLALAAAPFLWVTLDYARTHIPIFSFPWAFLGYGISARLSLLRITSFTGIYGLTFLVVAIGALLIWAVLPVWEGKSQRILRPRLVGVAVLLGLWVLIAPWLDARMAERAALEPARYRAALVQTNFPQAPSYPPDWLDLHAAELDELEHMSVTAANPAVTGAPGPGRAATPANLVVWPEVPAPFLLLEPRFAGRAQRIARNAGAPFLLGVVEWKPGPAGQSAFFNSAVLLDAQGQRRFTYDKLHLVPFGEFVPHFLRPMIPGSMITGVGNFTPGSARLLGELPDVPGPAELRTPRAARKFAVFICYEAIYPGEVRRFVQDGAELLINLSNDGWFGRSAAPEQHLAMARVRAAENHRWLLRDTNTGHTVAIDPWGRIVARMRPDERGVLLAPYDFVPAAEQTLYTRCGDWFAWLCAAVGVAAIFASRIFFAATPKLK